MELRLDSLRADEPAHLERFCAAWNAAWPDDPLTLRECMFELGMEPHAQRWIIEQAADGAAAADPVGVAEVQRTRWNPDDAPPISWIGLVARHRATQQYRLPLRSCARAARAWGFEELRVGCWEHETVLAALLQELGFVCAEEEVHVALQLADAPTTPPQLPAGVRLATLASEPRLDRAAWECFVAAGVDVPGDEPIAPPSYERWQLERTAPWSLPEACFLAVDADDVVLGFADLEVRDLPADVAWHGFTAVRAEHRGRGIAGALKLAVIAWARERGIRVLRTENEVGNAPMRHINARLGYRYLATRSDWRGSIEPLIGPPDR